MSKPRYRWWGFARSMIRDYPGLKKALEDLHAQSIVADMSGMPRGGSAGRTVENIALRQLPDDDQKVLNAVSGAIEATRLLADGQLHIDLISMMYWNEKPVTVKLAAPHLFISVQTAKRWHGDFVRLVGKCYGFNVDTPEPK